jgi:hypothetical protein
MTRVNRAVLAALSGLATGFLAWYLIMLRRRRIGARTRVAMVSRAPMTPALQAVHPADTHLGTPGENTEDRLDEGIQESFPASDPVSIRIE